MKVGKVFQFLNTFIESWLLVLLDGKRDWECIFVARKKGKVLHSVDFAKIYSRDIFQQKKTWNQFALCINCWITLLGVFTQFFQSVSKIFVFPHCVLTTSTSGSFTLILFSIRCLQTYCWVKWIHSKKNILKKAFFFLFAKVASSFLKIEDKKYEIMMYIGLL